MLFSPKNIRDKRIFQEDLDELIKLGIEENVHLEYKRELNSNENIAKSLSSFANSDGGNIIYGIIEEDHKPVNLNPLNPKDVKEKLDHIAYNGIDPSLNIKIWPVDIQTEIKQGQAFVVYIPKKYPYLHFSKIKHRYYKRTNFSSMPMERYEIVQAFKLISEKKISINLVLDKIEQEFVSLIDDHNLEIRLIVCPVQYGENMFQISVKMNDFLNENIIKTPNFHNDIIYRIGLSVNESFRVNDYFFPFHQGEHPASCIIKENGIIIYNLSYNFYEEYELEDFYKINDIYDKDDLSLVIESGILPHQIFFHREINADYLMGFFNFISKLYDHLHYFGDLLIKFKAKGIGNSIDYHAGSKFRQNQLEPIEKVYSSEVIQDNPINIIKDFFTPILIGFGYLPIDLEIFFSHVEHNRLQRQ